MIDTVETYAPGFKASVIARQSLSPLDLERIFGLPNGDIFHGAMTTDQLFSLAADARAMPTTACRCRGSICAARGRIPAAASPARRAITRHKQ